MKRLAAAVLSFLALFVIGSSTAVPCPTVEDLDPCTCKQTASGLYIVCANFKDNADIARAFKVLRNYELKNVLLDHLYFTGVLPSDLFSGLVIEELRVENSELEFSQPAFTGLEESLKTLTVLRSIIKSPNSSIATLGMLEELSFKEVSLGKVTNQWLNGKIPNVRILTLDNNEITDFELNAFSELKYIKKFSSAGNGIPMIARSMGPQPALYVESLDFSRNEMSELPDDTFTGVPKLKTFLFSGNNLKTVSEVVWSSFWEELDTVTLSGNPIVCDENLDWLRNKAKWPRVVTGNCVLPKELAGKSLVEVYKPGCPDDASTGPAASFCDAAKI